MYTFRLYPFLFNFVVSGSLAVATPQTSLPGLVVTEPGTGNASINVTGTNPIPRSFHIPNSAITLNFNDYTHASSVKQTDTAQTLVVALHSIAFSLIRYMGDRLVNDDTVSWSYGKVVLTIENHGSGGTRKLMWHTLADTVYGLGEFLIQEGCNSAEWTIEDLSAGGNIGYGKIGLQAAKNMGGGSAATGVGIA
ncbi:hypothetical protein MMC28_008350 [Mycoblastus sanguinarius]|nr:hypothetical protein [Mycoblastus sanguinarius]